MHFILEMCADYLCIFEQPHTWKGQLLFLWGFANNYLGRIELHNVYGNASQLRKLVCDFAIRKEHQMVKQLAELHDRNASVSLRSPWVPFFTNMKINHVFAKGPVLYCTALLVERDIAAMFFWE